MIRRRTRLLARTFFDRMFESELFSSPLSASNAVMWLLAALATPGVMFSGSQYYFYAHARTFTPEAQDRILFVSQAFHVDFAMAIAGLVTMLVWTSLAPDRRDALVLGPLPVRPGEQSRARLLALLRFFAMFVAAVSVPTAFAFTFVTVGDAAVGDVPARIAAHIVATSLGAAFVFFVLLDLQLLLAATVGPRAVAVATWPLQAAAVLTMVAAIAMTGRLADAVAAPQALADAWVTWNPAAWYVGVYRAIAGDAREIIAVLSTRGIIASVAAAGIALLAYPMAYRRCLANAIAGEGRRAGWWSGAFARTWLRLMAPALRTPLERGLAAFIIASLTRSHTHRFVIGTYVGAGLFFSLPLGGRLPGPATSADVQYAWFSVPLGIMCWTAAAFRVAMMLPVEPASNWIFRLTEPVDKARILSTAVTIVNAAAVWPLAAGFGLAATFAGGAWLGSLVFGVVVITGAALIEALTLSLRTVPGTCTYRPGQLRLRVWWPVHLMVWITVAYLWPTFAVRAYASVEGAAAMLGGILALWAALHGWRIARTRKLRALIFDELEPAVTTTIRLGAADA